MSWSPYDLTDARLSEPLTFTDPKEEEFLEQRLGRITGSEFGKLVVQTKDRKGYCLSSGKAAQDLIYRTVWERLLPPGALSDGIGRLNINSSSLQHGEDFEGEAILRYMEITGNKVDYTQRFIELDDFIGGTPDGFIGEDGLIEVKCPWNGGNQIKCITENRIYNPEYVYQIQGYLWITGRKWCDFVSYDPHLIPAMQIHIIRVQRDERIIQGIAGVMEQVKEKIKAILGDERFSKAGQDLL